MEAVRSKSPDNIQPEFSFFEIIKWNWDSLVGSFPEYNPEWNVDYVERKNPFSLEVLASVKAASLPVEETQQLPRRIAVEVEKYKDLNERIKANWPLLTFPLHQLKPNSKTQ